MKKSIAWLISLTIVLSTVGIAMANSYCRIPTEKECLVNACCSHCTADCCETDITVYSLRFESLPSVKIQVQSVTTDRPPSSAPACTMLSAESVAACRTAPFCFQPSQPLLQTFLN